MNSITNKMTEEGGHGSTDHLEQRAEELAADAGRDHATDRDRKKAKEQMDATAPPPGSHPSHQESGSSNADR